MLELGNHVVKTQLNGSDVLLNTITMQYLFADQATEESLMYLAMGKDQKLESIDRRLFSKPTECSIMFVTSWMCNLRCGHCSVLHQLKKTSPVIDVAKCKKFVDDYSRHYGISDFKIHFLGGESLLHPEVVMDLIDSLSEHNIHIGITSNLAVPLNAQMVRIVERSDITYVSLDGLEKDHNDQRKDFYSGNPFRTTVKNMKLLVELGLKDKIHVMASVRDRIYNAGYKEKFIDYCVRLGIHRDHIIFGCIYPTKTNNVPEQSYLRILKSCTPIAKPCCKFRFMTNFVIDGSNKVFSNYFSLNDSCIGSLDDSMESIEIAHKSQIYSTMPCLQDEKCKKCPVLGFCWGKCIVGEPLFGSRPSDFCDQEALISHTEKLSQNGDILEVYGGKTHCSSE